MIELLFMVVWWGGIALLAVGAVLLAGFMYFLATDLLDGMGALPPSPVRPYDWADPLERQFALPSAPEPRAR